MICTNKHARVHCVHEILSKAVHFDLSAKRDRKWSKTWVIALPLNMAQIQHIAASMKWIDQNS